MTGPGRQRVLTGDRPTGPLHLGHLAGSLDNRLALQRSHECFVLVADAQMLSDRVREASRARELVELVMSDYLAIGLDPKRTTFVLQSAVPELAELTMLLTNLVTVAQVGQNPTVKHEIRERNLERNLPLAFFSYPVAQAADILGFLGELVPVGEDQLPMIELSQTLAERFNESFSEVFPRPRAMLSQTPRLPGIDGTAKASKSLGNAILLSDSAAEVRTKVRAMFTDPGHLRVSDPGRVEGNVVFAYLDAFDPDPEGLEEMKAHYRRGGLGDTTVKARLVEVLEARLEPIRERRERLGPERGMEVLATGTERGRAVVAETMRRVRGAMGTAAILQAS